MSKLFRPFLLDDNVDECRLQKIWDVCYTKDINILPYIDQYSSTIKIKLVSDALAKGTNISGWNVPEMPDDILERMVANYHVVGPMTTFGEV